MPYSQLAILLPCHSLEDFPRHLEGDEAAGLLAGWSALWHPALVASARQIPTWHRADLPPTTLADQLLIVPAAAAKLLPTGWTDRVRGEGTNVVESLVDRKQIVAAALERLDESAQHVDTELAADFLALGTCYLYCELLTRHMRYVSQIDEQHFANRVVDTATSATSGDDVQARAKLGECLELLRQARDRYYPVDSYLIDLVLVAETTLGRGLARELAAPTSVNFLLEGRTLDALAERSPDNLAQLRSRLEQRTAAIVGGEQQWRELPLEPLESVLSNLRDGRETFQRWLSVVPSVFGRVRSGLSPVLPGVLARLGYVGGLHFTLDDGQFPQGEQARIRWQGSTGRAPHDDAALKDGAAQETVSTGVSLDALARAPLDAAQPGEFLRLAHKLGESMDLDQVAVVTLAHWAGVACPFLDDLRRIARLSTVLGKLVTLDEFFAQTEPASRPSRLPADQYRAPYLVQAAAAGDGDAVTRTVESQRLQAESAAFATVKFLTEMVQGTRSAIEPVDLPRQMESFAQALPRSKASSEPGYLVVNPHSFARREVIELPAPVAISGAAGPVKAVQTSAGRHWAVIDVPALGFAWFPKDSSRTGSQRELQLADGLKLRNEFGEVAIDPRTGGIRSVHDFKHRENRLSQRLAFRGSSREADEADAILMQAENVEIVFNGPVLAAIESRGRLAPREGAAVARFTQRVEIARGSRVIRVEIELECLGSPGSDPWNSYYACRWAWSGASVELRRGLGGQAVSTSARRIEAPEFLELTEDRRRTALLTGGLPYHRRLGDERLDTLLVAGGERTRRFRFGIGLDLPCVLGEVQAFGSPCRWLAESASPPEGAATGWLFHIDARGAVATAWETLIEEGRVVGFRVRLLETLGRATRIRLGTLRAVRQARCVDFRGHPLADLIVENDAIVVDMEAGEWAQIEAHWA